MTTGGGHPRRAAGVAEPTVGLWSGWVWAQPTPEQANEVLFVFSHGGYRPGDFTAALLEAMIRADPQNLGRLARGFPGYASAVHAARNVEDGLERLRILSGCPLCRDGDIDIRQDHDCDAGR